MTLDRRESQSCASHSLAPTCASTPGQSLIEDAFIRETCNGSRDRDGRQSTDKFAWRHEPDVVLPPPETNRWTSHRKAAILIAVRAGVMSREEACQRFFISEEELVGWEVAFERAGIPGLRVTTLQFYRRAPGLDSVIPPRPQTITALSSEILQETIIAPSTISLKG